jgi:radical SAM superfamily enzyme YgiQ (UPF0313 family)
MPCLDLARPRPFRVWLPVLLSGDLVQSPEHLGPAYLASVLRNAGAHVRIRTIAHLEQADWIEEVHAFAPDLVGLSLTTVSTDDAKRFGAALRSAINDRAYVVGGGPLATHVGGRLLDLAGWEFFDALVRGEGEVPILQLAYALQKGLPLAGVGSLIYRGEGGVRSNAIVPGIADLNSLPAPARDQLEEAGGKLPYLRISTSRGCTSHCTFCNAPHARNRVGPRMKAWRGVDPERVVDEIEQLVQAYGINTFDFVDSTFEDPGGGAVGKGRVEAIADAIMARGLTIYYNACMQAANWSEQDRPLLQKLRASGLEKVLVGMEAGSDTGLARWQKRSRVEDNERILDLLREIGVYVAFGFIAFHPWMGFEEYEENIDFLSRTLGHNLRRFTTRLELYPGAEVIGQLAADGLLDEDYYETLDIYGYRYADERVGHLARSLNAMYGADYVQRGQIGAEPAVFRFETHDIMNHNFSTRIGRALVGHPAGEAILAEFDEAVDQIRAELARRNAAYIGEFVALAKDELLDPRALPNCADMLERVFTDAMNTIDALKMKAGLKLRREGIDARLILAPATAVAIAS